jgi:hypothetical protein
LVERRLTIPYEVRSLYEKHRGKETNPSCQEYVDLLQFLAHECSEVYVAIDALDECINKDRDIIWSGLLSKLKSSVSNLRLFYTSRDIEDFAGILTGSTRIDIRASKADIEAYARAQIKTAESFLAICGKDAELQQLAFKVLTWIVYAVRPLQLEEVLHAVAVDELEPEDEAVTEDCLTLPSIIVNACAGLIRIDKKSDVVGLVHKTTQEYFDKNGINHFPHAHRDITTSCLRYLSLHVFSSGYCPSDKLFKCRLKENALLDYAVRSLGDHISQGFDCSLKDLALKVFLDERTTSSASQVLFVDMKWQFSRGYSQNFRERFQGVHFAAYFGLTDILKLLIETSKADVDSKDSGGQTPLSWAAERGHEAVVKLLLETGKGADVNAQGGYYGNALYAASWGGHEKVVELLLSKGADVNARGVYYSNALYAASWGGHEKVVELLLGKGADVNAQGGVYGNALQAASWGGHEKVVELLLGKGADVNARGGDYGSALQAASVRGHEKVVELLLGGGAVS